VVGFDEASLARKSAQPFVEWLQSAEEESGSGEDEN